MINIFGDIYSLRTHELPSEPDEGIDSVLSERARLLISESVNSLFESLEGTGILNEEGYVSMTVASDRHDSSYSTPTETDLEILRARAVMVAVQKQIGDRIGGLCRKRNALAPFSKLPLELAGTVLAAALPDPAELQGNYQQQLLLNSSIFREYLEAGLLREWAGVSSGWLGLVRTCPALWTLVGFGQDGNIELLKTQLRKSGTLPISIPAWPTTTNQNQNHLEIVLQHAARFRYVTLAPGREDRRAQAELISRFMSRPMPVLKRLELKFWCDQYWDALLDGGEAEDQGDANDAENGRIAATYDACSIGGGPQFTELILRNTLIHPNSPGLVTLQTLEVEVPAKLGPLEILSVLGSAVSLRSLSVSASEDQRTVIGLLPKWPKDNVLELPFLHHLNLTNMSKLATYLHTQSLRSLVLRHVNTLAMGDHGFEELLRPSRVILDYFSNVRPEQLTLELWGDASCQLRLPILRATDARFGRDDEPEESDRLRLYLAGYSIGSHNIDHTAIQSFLRALPPLSLLMWSLPERHHLQTLKAFPVVSVRLDLINARRCLRALWADGEWVWPRLREVCIDHRASPDDDDTTWVSYLGLEARLGAARGGLVSHWTVSVLSGSRWDSWMKVYSSEEDTRVYPVGANGGANGLDCPYECRW